MDPWIKGINKPQSYFYDLAYMLPLGWGMGYSVSSSTLAQLPEKFHLFTEDV